MPAMRLGAELALLALIGQASADDWATGLVGSESKEVVEPTELHVDGAVPEWLQGIFMKNGGSQFHAGERRYLHTFDAFAKLSKFEFQAGAVHFQSRFINSNVYNRSMGLKKILPTLTCGGVDPPVSMRERAEMVQNGMNDNTLIHTWELAPGRFIATADITTHHEFDMATLSTQGKVRYEDEFAQASNAAAGAHHVQAIDGSGDTLSWIGVPDALLPGQGYLLHLLRNKPGEMARKSVGSYQVGSIPQVHSFATTVSHVVIPVMPTTMNLAGAIAGVFKDGKGAMCPHVGWDASKEMDFVVFDLKTGAVNVTKTTTPFYFVHAVNAYHQGPQIISDYTCYDDPKPFYDPHSAFGYVDSMSVPENRPQVLKAEGFCRVTTNIESGVSTWVHHSPSVDANGTEYFFELPRMNEAFFGKEYCFVYGAGNPGRTVEEVDAFNGIVKRNLCEGQGVANTKVWSLPDYYATEPLFVKRPGGSAEDDGLLLSIAFSGEAATSVLLILDAAKLELIARVWLPTGYFIPNTYHSRFYPAKEAAAQPIVI